MKYSTLTEEQKTSIVEGHIQQVEQQHFSATVQLERAQTAAERDQIKALIASFEEQRKALEKFQTDG